MVDQLRRYSKSRYANEIYLLKRLGEHLGRLADDEIVI